MKLISIIVPCLNEQEVIPIFYRTVTEVLDSLENAEYELLFVDDGSDDRTLKVLKELKKRIEDAGIFLLRETSGKKPLFMQDSSMQKEIM